jgi:hypothetical protein
VRARSFRGLDVVKHHNANLILLHVIRQPLDVGGIAIEIVLCNKVFEAGWYTAGVSSGKRPKAEMDLSGVATANIQSHLVE